MLVLDESLKITDIHRLMAAPEQERVFSFIGSSAAVLKSSSARDVRSAASS